MSRRKQTTKPTFGMEIAEARARVFGLAARAGRWFPALFMSLSRAVTSLDRAVRRYRRGACYEPWPRSEPSPAPRIEPKPEPPPPPKPARAGKPKPKPSRRGGKP